MNEVAYRGWKEIQNGQVIPKGTGDLIDRNSVLDMMNYGVLEDYIESMPAVIKADKENKNERED